MGRKLGKYSRLLFKVVLLNQLYFYHNLGVDAVLPHNLKTCDGPHHHNGTYFEEEAQKNVQRIRRPVRLLPANQKEKNGTKTNQERFYGPASSCVEISKLGYTLNGYFLVKGKNQMKNDQVEVLGCLFKHPSGSKEAKEEKIGSIDIEIIKSTKSVKRRSQEPFDKLSLEAVEKDVDRSKRPARLLPFKILLGKPKNETETRFYGPATSCEELGKLGYTLNGLYLVDCADKSMEGKIEVIECRFKQPHGSKEEKEKRIGFVNVKIRKSKKVQRRYLNALMETRIIQRPARLLPLHILYGKEQDETEENHEVERFYGPPNNCGELGKLGYTLNGYYVVNGTGSRKIKIALCKFQHPPDATESFKEERFLSLSGKPINRRWQMPLPLDNRVNDSYLLYNADSQKCLESESNESPLLIQTDCNNPSTTKRWKLFNDGKRLCYNSARCISWSINEYNITIPALLPMVPANEFKQHLFLRDNQIKFLPEDLCVAALYGHPGVKLELCNYNFNHQKWYLLSYE